MIQVQIPRRDLIRRTPRHRKVLAIVGDTQVGLWVVRSLARGGLKVFSVVRSPQGQAAHSRFSRGAWVIESALHEPGFIEELRQLATGLDVGSILTVSEGYHKVLIENRHRFEPEIHLFSPERERFLKATDKDYMQQLCRELSVPVARGTTLDALLSGEADELRPPYVLRTRIQNDDALGRTPFKAAYAETREQFQALVEPLRPIASNVLVQEYHPGVEDHVQVLMHRGEPVMVGDYIGEAHMPLAGGVTVVRRSCHHAALVRDAVRLLQALQWEGIAGVQFHYDPATGEYIFLEINPRFIGGLPTVVRCGFEAPFMLWQSRFEPERLRPRPYRKGVTTRILGGHANWLFAQLRGDPLPPGQQRPSRLGAVARFLYHCGPWTLDDSFLLSDPRPFLVDFRQMLTRLGSRSVDIIGNPDAPPGDRA
jgi:predicted ATP-grasp superfamily ATP-dependent carboligase